MSVKEKISKLLDALYKGVYERENELKLALLSSIAGESIFLLGPPGVAKSLVARKLKFAYKDASVFEYLMSRFSTPDEIFGPVAISKLKEDKYERVLTKYLPSADVVFLDEIWKAGPSIQNSLLTVINEKIFRNGDEEIKVPMKALISASNELPAKDQGLEALWDRFLVRLVVKNIESVENFNKMISEKLNAYEDCVEPEDKITKDEYEQWSKEIDEIIVPDNVFNIILCIHNDIVENNGKNVSDRRWRKIVRLLRTSAYLNDRKEIDLMDCFLIGHCIWDEESQISAAYQFVSEAIEKHGYTVDVNFDNIKESIKVLEDDIKNETYFPKDTRVEVLVEIEEDYYEIQGLNKSADYNTKNQECPLLIEKRRYDLLSTTNDSIYLYYYNPRRCSTDYDRQFRVRKGKEKFYIIVDDKEYKLKTRIDGENIKKTKKPHPSVEKTWDEQVSYLLETTNKWANDIEQHCNKDLEHLRTNLFTLPELANIVESHITATKKEIAKIEVSIRKIQNDYRKLKDEEIVLKDEEIAS